MRTNSLQVCGLIGLLIVLFFAGCGSEAEPLAEQAPTQTPVIIVVTATDETLAGGPDTQEADVPTAALQPEATATPLVPMCRVVSGVRLRTGPGQIYGIIRNLATNTALSPEAFLASGFPTGAWLQVSTDTQDGWVSASPDLVSCNVEPASLPAPNVIPPTPTPIPPPTAIPPTPTPVVVAELPISIGQPSNANNPDAGDFPQGRVEWRLETSNDFLFRFYVRDIDVGDYDGAGVETVTLTVQDQSGHTVDSRTEGTAGYCIFGGGEPVCNSWEIDNGVYKWRSTGETVIDGIYNLSVSVQPEDDDRIWTWSLGDFYVDAP